MPGVRSLAARQYYAHPQNAFWKILGEVFGFDPTLEYPERVRRLTAARVAVWDVLQSCEREGSLDTAIDSASAVPNDFAGFFHRHPLVRVVCFNGGTAERYFQRKVLPDLSHREELRYLRLPSTSPAHAGLPYVEKLARWRAALSLLTPEQRG
jgi:TDG/mug DNA glycosylase family protein